MTSQEQTTTPQLPKSDIMPASSDSASPSSPAPSTEPADSQQPTEAAPSSPNPPLNPRLAALAARDTTLQATLSTLHTQRAALATAAKLPSGLDMPADWSEEQKTKQALASANAVIKEHIALLHKYNGMKDIGLGLLGLIADKRGVRVGGVMEEFGVGEKD